MFELRLSAISALSLSLLPAVMFVLFLYWWAFLFYLPPSFRPKAFKDATSLHRRDDPSVIALRFVGTL